MHHGCLQDHFVFVMSHIFSCIKLEMRCRVNGILYRIITITCHPDGIVIHLIRHGVNSVLEFGEPEYFWMLNGDRVNFVKFSPLTKAHLIKLCKVWYAISQETDDKENQL